MVGHKQQINPPFENFFVSKTYQIVKLKKEKENGECPKKDQPRSKNKLEHR